MRICLYTGTSLPKIGGQELVVDALGRQFTALGHEVVVLAPYRRSQGQLDPRTVPYEVAWHPRFCSTRWFVAWYGRWLAQLHRKRPLDVIHCHGTYPAGYVAASCPATRDVPLVITSHGVELAPQGLYDRKPPLRDRFQLALKRAGAALAISDYTEQRFRETCPSVRIERMPNGVDTTRFTSPVARPADLPASIQPGRYALYLGRLEWRKGPDVLLRAFAEAAHQCDIRLVIAGAGPERDALEALAASLGLADRVYFLGAVEGDTKTYLLQNGLFTVIPSRLSEAFPLVVLESYAASRAVLGTQVVGLADLIDCEQTGLVVPCDCPNLLAAAILRAIRQPEQTAAWGTAGRRIAQRYDWRCIAERHLSLFEELIAQRRLSKAA